MPLHCDFNCVEIFQPNRSKMKYLVCLYFFAIFFFKNCSPCFTKTDVEIIYSLVQPLERSFCVFVKESCQILEFSKILMKNNIYYSYFRLSDFLQHFVAGKIPERRTMIVFKADNTTDAYDMAKQLTQKVK